MLRPLLMKHVLHSPSAFFAVFAGTVFLVYLVAAALVSLNRFFMDVSGIDILAAVGNSSNTGVNKLQVLGIFLGCCLVVTGGVFLMLVRRPGIAGRLSVLVMLVPAYLATITFLHYPVHHAALLEQIEIKSVLPLEDPSFFSKSNLAIDRISNEDELYRTCRSRFESVRDSLRKRWSMGDDRKLEALFLMNVVSALWGFGNSVHHDRTGCVDMNEQTGFRLDVPDNVRAYLQSEIGCCSDSAYLLKLLLDRAGIPSRRVIIAHGHVMNEAHFTDGWMTLDATTNMAFVGDWTSIQKRRGQDRNAIRVFLFPHSNHLSVDNPHYRPEVGHLRLALLLDAVNKSAFPVAFPDGFEEIRPAAPLQPLSKGDGLRLPAASVSESKRGI